MDIRDGAEGCGPNTTRTDLSLLLERIKFQMKFPDQQKQALQTIFSICEQRGDNVEMLREMGGIDFLLNLSKSSFVHSDVQETALFTLGRLIEANACCRNLLCRKEIFTDLADCLVKEDVTLTKKRVIVYFVSVLVANNKFGQLLSLNTRCLDVLLDLFRATFPLSPEGAFKTASSSQLHQLWSSASSALCGCVNNPHNEEAQRACRAVFPAVKTWIQQISLPRMDIFKPICSFITMTVANNPRVQESFAALGGLQNLTLALIRFCLGSETSQLARQLAVSISNTLSACVSDHCGIAAELAHFQVVRHLVSLLINPTLGSDDRLALLLTMGHFTEASGEHQEQLVRAGGLPVILTLLVEDSDEKVRTAAAFVLQTCKRDADTFWISDVAERNRKDVPGSSTDSDIYKKSAKRLLQRITELEKNQAEAENRLAWAAPQDPKRPPATVPAAAEEGPCPGDEDPGTARGKWGMSGAKLREDTFGAGGEALLWPPLKRTKGIERVFYAQRLEGAREPQEHLERDKAPAPPKYPYSPEEDVKRGGEEPDEERSAPGLSCTGCLLRFHEANSRTFASLQGSRSHSCVVHEALREAAERFRSRHRRLLARRDGPRSSQQPTSPGPSAPAAQSQRNQKNWSGIALTPMSKAQRSQATGQQQMNKDVRLTPLHKGMRTEGPAFRQTMGPAENKDRKPSPGDGATGANPSSNSCSQRRRRRGFSREEELYLLRGAQAYGRSWNMILWSYPFLPGRTSVDLAQKHRRLMKDKALAELWPEAQ